MSVFLLSVPRAAASARSAPSTAAAIAPRAASLRSAGGGGLGLLLWLRAEGSSTVEGLGLMVPGAGVVEGFRFVVRGFEFRIFRV